MLSRKLDTSHVKHLGGPMDTKYSTSEHTHPKPEPPTSTYPNFSRWNMEMQTDPGNLVL